MLYKSNSEQYDLDTMILDLNGTLAVGGEVDVLVPEIIKKLVSMGWKLYLLTGDQRGNAETYAQYGLEVIKAKNAEQKKAFMKKLDKEKCVAIGNARIDIGMFELAKIRIVTLQGEGIHAAILPYTDIIIPSMKDALMLFVDSDRFSATMKV